MISFSKGSLKEKRNIDLYQEARKIEKYCLADKQVCVNSVETLSQDKMKQRPFSRGGYS